METEVLFGLLGVFVAVLGSTWTLGTRIARLQGAIDVVVVEGKSRLTRLERLEGEHQALEHDFRVCREQHLVRAGRRETDATVIG